MTAYALCTIKPWNIDAFHSLTPYMPGEWHLIEKDEDLGRLYEIMPRYVFFPHWSWKVPAQVLKDFECVCFHMTDVPYGRGGSPLQNLIMRGHKETKLTALRMVEELDAGPVYYKSPLSLDGTAYDIYCRAAALIYPMMMDIITKEPTPIEQSGEPVVFKRRTTSRLEPILSIEEVYDYIRMTDAPTYQKAFIEFDSWRLEFDSAIFEERGTVKATVTFSRKS